MLSSFLDHKSDKTQARKLDDYGGEEKKKNSGGLAGIRTLDQLVKSQLLYR